VRRWVVGLALGLAGIAGATCGAAQTLKIAASLPSLEDAAHRDSTDAVAHYNLALGYWSKERWAQADTALRAALALDSRFAAAYLALAYLPRASGKFWTEKIIVLGGGWRLHLYSAADSVMERYYRLYRRAVMIDPLVDVRIVVATEYRGGHIDDFDRALYAYNDSKWDEAWRRFTEIIADSGNYRGERGTLYEQALWYHALAAARLAKHDDAIRDLGNLVERSQRKEASDTMYRWPLRTNEYRYVLAYVKQRAGDPNGALTSYREALANNIGLYMAHVRMGEIYEGASMWDNAVLARRNAINANPDDASLLLDLGKTLANAGRFDQALEPLQQAADASPRDARPYLFLGLALERLGKRDEARAALTRFTSLAPSRYDRQIAIAQQHLAALQ
jgi:tetratricopeptide (TPR) repeat protein